MEDEIIADIWHESISYELRISKTYPNTVGLPIYITSRRLPLVGPEVRSSQELPNVFFCGIANRYLRNLGCKVED